MTVPATSSTHATPSADLGLHVHLPGGIDESIAQVTAALKEQGFGI